MPNATAHWARGDAGTGIDAAAAPTVDTAAQPLEGLELFAHLFRRAGFGATPEDIERAIAEGYEATVARLLHPEQQPDIDVDFCCRYWPEMASGFHGTAGYWMHRMINTSRPLEEKMTFFWHSLFATSRSKVRHWHLFFQNETLRSLALANFADLLLAISKDPAMIVWLDNKDSDKLNVNENYGRELMELFSMGIGNYTEADVKASSRAFTGWTVKPYYPLLPHGFFDPQFVYMPDRHDEMDKTFLGQTGNLNGEDIIRIIVEQPAAARYVARKLHAFFVSDTPDEAEIAELAEVFAATQGDMRAVMETLLMAPWFRSRKHYLAKLKMPVELVVSTVRLTGTDREPTPDVDRLVDAATSMGQEPFNPPSVKGWDGGVAWIDTGLLTERVNFAATELGDATRPGVAAFVRQVAQQGPVLKPGPAVDAAAWFLGPIQLAESSRRSLVDHLSQDGDLTFGSESEHDVSARRLAHLLQLVSATAAFQFN
jgi:uncharacterized protein (DUF1800 family)